MIPDFIRRRSLSLSMVVLVLLFISLLQEGISYTTVFGSLDNYIPGFKHGLLPSAWFIFRGILVAIIISFAFSPTDALSLMRRAKAQMLLQTTISIITLTGIAGSAINILAGSH